MRDNLFRKLRSAAVNAAANLAHDLRKKMQQLVNGTKTLPTSFDFPDDSPHPTRVKQLIPKSHFTKKGPGVSKEAHRCFIRMTHDQRATARRMGWYA